MVDFRHLLRVLQLRDFWRRKSAARVALSGLVLLTLQGCTVIAIADTVGTVAVKTVGLAADATLGVVKLSGQAIGAVLPGDE